MNTSFRHLMTHQRVLLLQGKMGTFFCRFASFLMGEGIHVSKINFNAGDAFFYCHKDHATSYRGTVDDFAAFLRDFIKTNAIDAVVCFNDCRPHHLQAKAVCRSDGVSFFVFEEGYLRPDYITLEENGINGYSQFDPSLVEEMSFAQDKPAYTNNRFWRLCVASIIYYAVTFLGQPYYPHYRHYRNLSIWQEAYAWLVAVFRKLRHYSSDKRLQRTLITTQRQRYFLVTLQVHNDSQITHHSQYNDVVDFIKEVMQSFAAHAPKHTLLVFKHHPLDRGHRDYRALIATLAEEYGMAGRAFYGCDMHLPTLIKGSIGMVTVNSTTALQAIYHKKPTKVTGRALYNVARLSDPQPLDDFWVSPSAPDYDFYLKFREYLIEQTQLNGSFYGKSPWKLAYQNFKANQNTTNQSATNQNTESQNAKNQDIKT